MRTNTVRVMLALAVAITSVTISELTFAGGQKASELVGTSWQLVRLQGPDDNTMVEPSERSKYTIKFGGDGRVAVRVDCNRGGSSWSSTGAGALRFGSWSMTRAKCPAGSLHDRIVMEGAAVRSYSIKDGHLFLSGMAAGGFYELEPLRTQNSRPAGSGED